MPKTAAVMLAVAVGMAVAAVPQGMPPVVEGGGGGSRRVLTASESLDADEMDRTVYISTRKSAIEAGQTELPGILACLFCSLGTSFT